MAGEDAEADPEELADSACVDQQGTRTREKKGKPFASQGRSAFAKLDDDDTELASRAIGGLARTELD